MDDIVVGDRVTVTEAGPALNGIVFDTPSRAKVVVAVMDRDRGPGFRTVHPDALTLREEDGTDEAALRLLIRRTPPPTRGRGRGAPSTGRGQAAHTRAAMHRTTGK